MYIENKCITANKIHYTSEKDLDKHWEVSKIMASGPITSWQIVGETMETVTDYILGGSKITADDDCSHEIKRCLLLGRKVVINLGSIVKSRDITLPTKVHLVKAMAFPVVMYGCESWTIKKTEHWRIDAFELWYWRELLRVPWTTKLSNQSILKEISPETPILWTPDVKNWLTRKDPDAGKDWRQEETGMTEDEMVGWASPIQWTLVWVSSGSWWWTGKPGVLQFMGSQRVEHEWDWTELIYQRFQVCSTE